MKKAIFLLFAFLSIVVLGFSQTKTLKSRVKNKQGEPLIGATVRLLQSKQGTITDADGNFSLSIEGKDTLIVQYIGYESAHIPVGPDNLPAVITLQSNANQLNQLVVTGYQIQKKVDVTGSVAVADLDEIKDVPNNNLMSSLQGRVPGLYTTGSGAPDGGVSEVSVRGFNTLGSTSPLYVIDGVATTNPSVFQSLNPSSIKTIQVLKDAASASIYGSRASNGVIIVTTKAGGRGKVKVQFNNSVTISQNSSRVNVLDSKGLGKAIWQAAINDGKDPNSSTTLFTYTYHEGDNGYPVLDNVKVIPTLKGGNQEEPSANTDWQNEVYQPGITTSNSLTLTAGSENSSLLIGLNYLNNTGMLKYSKGYRRYGARINASTNLFDNIVKIGNNVHFFSSSKTPVPLDLGGASIFETSRFLSPLIPVKTSEGDFAGPLGSGFSDRNNPLHILYLNRWNKNKEMNLFGNLFIQISPIKDLVFRSNFGYNYDNTHARLTTHKYQEGFILSPTNSLTLNEGRDLELTWSNTVNYHLDAGNSSLSFLLGIEALKRVYKTQSAYKEDFALQTNDYFQLDAGTGNSTNGGTQTGNRLFSYFGKIDYALSHKYLASVTLRRDGSSRFGIENRYGWFPAASVGWRINKEPFLIDVPWLSNLKIRSSFGITGNQEIEDAASRGLYKANYGTVGETGQFENYPEGANNGTAYDLSGEGSGILPSGFVSVQAANPTLRWESTREFNEGIDFGFFDDRLRGSFDYFMRKTKNILVQPPYPGIEGEGQEKWVNGATMSNKGWEFILTYQNQIGELSYALTGNMFSFKSKITSLPASVISAYPGNVEHTILGHSPQSLFGYVVEGIFQDQKEVDQHATQTGAEMGRLMYRDLNQNGKIDALDQTWLGVSLPKLNYGLNVNLGYKAFNFSFFFQGIQGKMVENPYKTATDFVGLNPGVNVGQRTLKAWTPVNKSSHIPALSLVDNNNESRFSSYFIENGSYLKLRNVELAYTVPQKMWHLDQIKVYVMAENVVTFKKSHGADAFTGLDPENPGNRYPVPRKFTVGLNLSF